MGKRRDRGGSGPVFCLLFWLALALVLWPSLPLQHVNRNQLKSRRHVCEEGVCWGRGIQSVASVRCPMIY